MKLLSTGILKKIIESDENKIKKSLLPMDRMSDAFKTENSPITLSRIGSKNSLPTFYFLPL
jgi:hypothetical protein